MPDLGTYGVFCLAALALLVVPGPSVLYIVTRSIDQGRGAGLASVAGVSTGTLVHATAAAIGLSAVIASSATLFEVVKWAGAAYLVWIGLQRMLVRDPDAETVAVERRPSLRRVYGQGVVINVLNPKTALFFLALLPQFVDPGDAVGPQVLLLGATVAALGFLSDGAYALLAARAGRWLRGTDRSARRVQIASGGILVGLGVVAATTDPA